MTAQAISIIAHPTDFSPESFDAFLHALRMALDTNSRLYVLHVKKPGSPDEWISFPHVREVLVNWGLMEVNASPSQIQERLGIQITKVEIQHRNPSSGLFEFIVGHRPDLVVLATHGRDGLNHWLRGSVSEELARRTHIPTLFFGPKSNGFVDLKTGEIHLKRILVPIAHDPSPLGALNVLTNLLAPFGVSPAAFHFLYVGDDPPRISAISGEMELQEVEVVEGSVVDSILGAAQHRQDQLIVMPTVGHHGFIDALRGSTTEQVLRHAFSPVLAIRAAR